MVSLPRAVPLLLMVMWCWSPPSASLPPPLPAAPNNCPDMLDVAIIADMSDSMSDDDAKDLKLPLENLVNQLQLTAGGHHMALLAYSDQVLVKTDLTGDPTPIQASVQNLKPQGGPADPALALKDMVALMEGPQGRPGVHKTCILITDETSPDPAETARQAAIARSKGIELRVLSVSKDQNGPVDKEARQLVGDQEHVLHADTYGQLDGVMDLASMLLLSSCPDPDSTTQQPTATPSVATTLKHTVQPASTTEKKETVTQPKTTQKHHRTTKKPDVTTKKPDTTTQKPTTQKPTTQKPSTTTEKKTVPPTTTTVQTSSLTQPKDTPPTKITPSKKTDTSTPSPTVPNTYHTPGRHTSRPYHTPPRHKSETPPFPTPVQQTPSRSVSAVTTPKPVSNADHTPVKHDTHSVKTPPAHKLVTPPFGTPIQQTPSKGGGPVTTPRVTPVTYHTPVKHNTTPDTYHTPVKHNTTPDTYQTPGKHNTTPDTYHTPVKHNTTPDTYQTPGKHNTTPDTYQTPVKHNTTHNTHQTPVKHDTHSSFKTPPKHKLVTPPYATPIQQTPSKAINAVTTPKVTPVTYQTPVKHNTTPDTYQTPVKHNTHSFKTPHKHKLVTPPYATPVQRTPNKSINPVTTPKVVSQSYQTPVKHGTDSFKTPPKHKLITPPYATPVQRTPSKMVSHVTTLQVTTNTYQTPVKHSTHSYKTPPTHKLVTPSYATPVQRTPSKLISPVTTPKLTPNTHQTPSPVSQSQHTPGSQKTVSPTTVYPTRHTPKLEVKTTPGSIIFHTYKTPPTKKFVYPTYTSPHDLTPRTLPPRVEQSSHRTTHITTTLSHTSRQHETSDSTRHPLPHSTQPTTKKAEITPSSAMTTQASVTASSHHPSQTALVWPTVSKQRMTVSSASTAITGSIVPGTKYPYVTPTNPHTNVHFTGTIPPGTRTPSPATKYPYVTPTNPHTNSPRTHTPASHTVTHATNPPVTATQPAHTTPVNTPTWQTTPGGQQTPMIMYYIPPFMPLVYPLNTASGTKPCLPPLTPLGSYVIMSFLLPGILPGLNLQHSIPPQSSVTPTQPGSSQQQPCTCGGQHTRNLPYPWNLVYPQVVGTGGLVVPVPLVPVGYLTIPGVFPTGNKPAGCQHTISPQPLSTVTPSLSPHTPSTPASTPLPTTVITSQASSKVTATTAPLATSSFRSTSHTAPVTVTKYGTHTPGTRMTVTPTLTPPATPTPSPTRLTEAVTTPTHPAKTTPPFGLNNTVVPSVACNDCLMVNGVGYKAHWARCDAFLQCQVLADHTVMGTVHYCPHGLHWNRAALTCTRPLQAACSMDRCLHSTQGMFPAVNNCRGYWVCQSGRSQGKCCPPGYSFGGRIGCIPDTACQDSCGVTTSVPRTCDKRVVPRMPLTFEQYIPGAGWKLMFCAPGTAYNHSTCGCTDFRANSAIPNTCRAELYLPFKGGDVKDESGNNNFVLNEGVKVINGAGYFNGRAVLRVPRFANTDYGDYVLIRLRYKQDGGGGGGQALVANGDCLKPSSLYMVAGQKATSFGSVTTTGHAAVVNVPNSGGRGWKEAVMYVDRQTLTGSVDNFSMQTLFTGSLAGGQCALQIGSGTSFSHFKGFMDDITVYLCRPDTL